VFFFVCSWLPCTHSLEHKQAAYIIRESSADPVSGKPDLMSTTSSSSSSLSALCQFFSGSSRSGSLKLNMSNVMPAITIQRCTIGDTESDAYHKERGCSCFVKLSTCRDVLRRQQETTVTSRCELSIVHYTQTQKKPLVVKQDVQDKRTVVFASSVEAPNSDSEEF